jgi:hypothetical protein
MAMITDPDLIAVGTEITLDTSARTFTLVQAGDLVAKDGVDANALWSFFVDIWATSTYQPYPFPMNKIDNRSGQYIFGRDPGGNYNGWKPANDVTRQMIRNGGWREYSAAGVLNREYFCAVLQGSAPSGCQAYYLRKSVAAGGTPIDYTFTDLPNEAVQVYGDSGNGNFDDRAYFKSFIREEAYLYDDASLTDISESATGPYKLPFGMSSGADLKITDTDANVGTITPYTKINVKYFPAAFTKAVESATGRNFGIVIDAGTHSGVDGSMSAAGSTLSTAAAGITGADFAGGTLKVHEGTNKGTYTISGTPAAGSVTITGSFAATESNASFTLYPAASLGATLAEIYTKIQYLLRQSSDIDASAGTVVGQTADLLLNFVGDSLKCGFYAPTNPNGGGSGVLIEGIRDADLNSIVFYDNSAVDREYPYASAGTFSFNSPLVSGGTGYYKLYYTTTPNNDDFGEGTAVVVNDKDGNPIQGTISGASVSFSFDYSNNVQGGYTGGTNRNVTLVWGNPGQAKPGISTGTITQSKAIAIAAVAEVDPSYVA